MFGNPEDTQMTQGLIALDADHQALYDRESFTTTHGLVDHPLLKVDALAELIQRLPRERVFYSSGSVDRDADFDRAALEHPPKLELREAMKDLETADSYIMVNGPESDPEYQPLFRDILGTVESYTRDLDPEIRDPMLYLFISSPHSTTPFHVDRYITFLMQITGNKKLFVWPASDRETVSEEALETLFADPSQRSPLLPPSREEYCTEHSLSPGECLHIPFTAPHWVKNGDEVSISLSIIFRTRRTDRLRNAYQLNYGLRRRLGWAPFPVRQSPLRDHSKDLLLRTYSNLRTSPRRVLSSVRSAFET